MRPSVRDAFYDFNAPLEGVVEWMYLDVKGLVTVGVGNMLPTESAAAALPFYRNGNPDDAADDATKRQGWRDVRARQDLAPRGHVPFQDVCGLRLTRDAIRALVDSKLSFNEVVLKESFPRFDDWPADAQLGLLSMAWAMGPGFASRWPKFTAACRALDFDKAADECRMSEQGNPGVVPRNDADQKLFRNAARVVQPDNGYDADTLYYPTVLLDAVVITGGGGDGGPP
jgi:GH24 family phage-related lysozyme (muramidase)